MIFVIDIRQGMAYQKDRELSVRYDNEYFEKLNYKDKKRHEIINQKRVEIVNQYIQHGNILDYGSGNNSFLQEYINHNSAIWGYDINPVSMEWLIKHYRYAVIQDTQLVFKAVTMWDVLEHLPEPDKVLKYIVSGSYLFISIPIFEDITQVENDKHYRPYEHYWYFTDGGLRRYLDQQGFDFIQKDDFEIKAGRENIYTYVFRRK